MYGPTILLIGESLEALRRRAELLARGGHDVEVAVGRDRGILACSACTFDVIVIEAATEFEAEKLARDVSIVAPSSELVNLNRWYERGLTSDHEAGFLLSLLTTALKPVVRSHAAPRARRRSSR